MLVLGPLSVRQMFLQLLVTTGHLLMKWQRLEDKILIDPVYAFTGLRLDRIALHAFDCRLDLLSE